MRVPSSVCLDSIDSFGGQTDPVSSTKAWEGRQPVNPTPHTVLQLGEQEIRLSDCFFNHVQQLGKS
jgi:hypothetical protein